MKAAFEPTQVSSSLLASPSFQQTCQVGMKGALMLLGEGGSVGGEGSSQAGGGQFGGLGESSLCWCCRWQLQFHWTLFSTGLAPSPRNGKPGTGLAEGGWGRLDPGSRGARMRTCGETQSTCLTQLSPHSHINYSTPASLPLKITRRVCLRCESCESLG